MPPRPSSRMISYCPIRAPGTGSAAAASAAAPALVAPALVRPAPVEPAAIAPAAVASTTVAPAFAASLPSAVGASSSSGAVPFADARAGLPLSLDAAVVDAAVPGVPVPGVPVLD